MLISYEHKFIFVHIYKVAGTSITNALERFVHKPNMISAFLRRLGIKQNNHDYSPLHSHSTAIEIKNNFPEQVFNSFFTFAFVRNPWDWQVSLYHYMLQNSLHRQHKLIKSMKDFGEYLEWRVREDKKLQKDFVTDYDGKIILDFVGKYEYLSEDFDHVCKTLNIAASLPHLKKSKHRDYRMYYNDQTKRLIEEHFSEDIDLFQYRF